MSRKNCHNHIYLLNFHENSHHFSPSFNVSRPLPLHFLRRNSKAGDVDIQQHSLAKYLMEVTPLPLSSPSASISPSPSSLLPGVPAGVRPGPLPPLPPGSHCHPPGSQAPPARGNKNLTWLNLSLASSSDFCDNLAFAWTGLPLLRLDLDPGVLLYLQPEAAPAPAPQDGHRRTEGT